MDIEFENTLDDVLALNMYHFQQSPGKRYIRMLFQYGLPGIPLLVYVVLVAGGGSSFMSALPWLLLALVLFVLVPFSTRRSLRKRVIRMVTEGESRGAVGRHQLSVTRSAITDKTGHSKTTTNWVNVKKVVLTDKYVFIYISDASAHIVPRSAFTEAPKWEEFRDTVQKYYQAVIG